jgi:hypothetical protein
LVGGIALIVLINGSALAAEPENSAICRAFPGSQFCPQPSFREIMRERGEAAVTTPPVQSAPSWQSAQSAPPQAPADRTVSSRRLRWRDGSDVPALLQRAPSYLNNRNTDFSCPGEKGGPEEAN